MKLIKLHIDDFGPITSSLDINFGDFTLIYGNNENGKTLIVDAIINLLGLNNEILEKSNRVTEQLQGFVKLNYKNKTEIIDNKKKFSQIINNKIVLDDLKNIFIIRDSELSTNNTKYYNDISSRLLNTKITILNKTIIQIENIGRLTSTGKLSNSLENNKIASTIEEAIKIINSIDNLFIEIKDSNFEIFESILITLQQKSEETKLLIKKYDDALKREKYQFLTKKKERTILLINQLKKLEQFSSEESEKIKMNISRAEQLTTKKLQLAENLKKLEQQNENYLKKINTNKIEINLLKNKKLLIENEILPEIKTYLNLQNKNKSLQTFSNQYKNILFFTMLFTTISITAFYINKSSIELIFTIIFILLSITIFFLFKSTNKELNNITTIFNKIIFSSKKLGFNSSTVEDLITEIGNFDENLEKNKEILNKITENKIQMKTEISYLQNDIQETEEMIYKIEEENNKIFTKTQTTNIDEYIKLTNDKKQKESEIQTIIGEISNETGKQCNSTKELISILNEETNIYKQFENSEIKIVFNKEKYNNLLSNSINYENEIKQLSDKTRIIRNNMKEIESKVNNLLTTNITIQPGEEELEETIISDEKDKVYCRNTNDLKTIQNMLQKFIDTINKTKDYSQIAKNIINDIKIEEKEKLSTIFTDESNASKIFSEISKGKYKSIVYNTEENRISVINKNDIELEPEQLSGGTFDQLYFSIRIAIGEKILNNEKGFFILDDPFIKSDKTRLKKQMELISELVNNKWQIIYLSAKEEIKNIFDDMQKQGIPVTIQHHTIL